MLLFNALKAADQLGHVQKFLTGALMFCDWLLHITPGSPNKQCWARWVLHMLCIVPDDL
jgi:hypothetical protein